MKNKVSSILLLFLTAMIWGFAFVSQVEGGKYLGNFYYNGIRFIMGGLILIPVIMIFEKQSPQSTKISVLSGVCAGVILFVAANLQQAGINITGSSGKGGFLTATYSVIVPILARVFLKKRTNRNTWSGAVISLVGLFLILSGSMSSKEIPFITGVFKLFVGKHEYGGVLSVGAGDIVLLLCGLSYAVHVVFIDYFGEKIKPITFSSTQFITCGIISLVIAVFTESISASAVNGALVSLLYSAIMSTGVAYTLQVIGQRGVHPTLSAIILSTESMFAAIGGALLLNERMTLSGYVGCAVMMAGIIIAQLPVKRR